MLWDNPIAGELVRTWMGIGIVAAIFGGGLGSKAMGLSQSLFSLGFVTLLAIVLIGWFRSSDVIADPDAIIAWILSGDPLGDLNFRWFAAMLLAAPFLFGWLIGGALKAAMMAGND
jgi:hypothetical protein